MPEKRSLYYDEFQLGDKFFSGLRTIGVDDINRFADISGDRMPIHTDDEFAKNTLYGERIAHGLIGLSIASGLAYDLGFAQLTTTAFRELEWKFKKPIKIGDSIKAVYEVIEKKDLPIEGNGLIRFLVKITNQHDKTVQTGKWSLIIKKR